MKTGKQLLIAFLLLLLPLMHVSAQNQDTTAKYLEEFVTGMNEAVTVTPWQGVVVTAYSQSDSNAFPQTWSTSNGFKTQNLAVSETDRFLFRSFTKVLTATVILQLHERGTVHIDSSLSKYIEPVTNVDSTITLRDLLSMRANVCNYVHNSWAIIDEDPTAIHDTRDILEQTIPEGPCNSEKKYIYNDTNFQLLGLVIESVTGKSGESVFEDTFIIDPYSHWQDPHTWFENDDFIYARHPQLAPIDIDPNSLNGVWTEENGQLRNQFGESLNAVLTAQKYSAGFVGRNADMIRLLAAILTPGKLLSQESINMMTDGEDDNYGLGLQIYDYGSDPNAEHANGENHILYGHTGAGLHASTTFYNPVRRIGYSFAGNTAREDLGWLYHNLETATRRNYERLYNCTEGNGCVYISAPNPLYARNILGEFNLEYEDWDGKLDTLFLEAFSSIHYDSIGQGYAYQNFSYGTYYWEYRPHVYELGYLSKYFTMIDIDNSTYDGVPNPVFGNLKNINDFIGIYEIEFFNGRSDTTVETNGNCYLKSNYSIPVDPYYIRESKNSLVSYNGRWEDICYGDITNVSTPEPSFHIQGVVSNSEAGPYWWFYFDAYLPPSYYSDTTSTYPVVYFVTDSASTLDDFEGLTNTMNDMMSNDNLEESILVMLGNSNSTLGHSIEEAITVVSNSTITENFRANDKACIMGVSGGGLIAMEVGIRNKNKFDCIVSHSAPLNISPAGLQSDTDGGNELPIHIYFDTDTLDELSTYSFNENFSDSLNSYGFRNQYFYEVYESGYSEMLEERYKISLAFIDSVFKGGIVPTVNELVEENPFDINLSQNYPNPFNPSTTISYQLTADSYISLKIYDALGREVATLENGYKNSGNHTVNFDASQLSSGVYIYRLVAGNQSITKKMMLIK